jgi:choline kinase
MRLQQLEDEHFPKCLLRFGGMSLVERHLRLLKAVGVEEIVLALGFRHELVADELDRLQWRPRPEIVLNPQFELGSVLTVHAAAGAMTGGGDVLLMDADVLYDARIARALVAGDRPVNRLLIDREFEAGDEPVKVCVRDGVPSASRWASSASSRGARAAWQRWSRATRHAARGTCRTRRLSAICFWSVVKLSK